jgi:hypothetical protein
MGFRRIHLKLKAMAHLAAAQGTLIPANQGVGPRLEVDVRLGARRPRHIDRAGKFTSG